MAKESKKGGKATTLVNHPDGRICEIPVDVLDRYVVPPERVKDLARKAGARAAAQDAAAGPAAAHDGDVESHSIVVPESGQTVVFNFYLGPQARLMMHGQPAAGEGAGAEADVEGYHMDLDAMGSMTMHSDWRVGPFIDRSGRPAFGPHSHDPVGGNAQ